MPHPPLDAIAQPLLGDEPRGGGSAGGGEGSSSGGLGEFGGPGDRWSPETLLLAAVADCYALSFRVLAANSKLGFRELTCRAEGAIDRADGKIRFTEIALDVEVALAGDANPERARRLLERAKDVCIISNSLSGLGVLKSEMNSMTPLPASFMPSAMPRSSASEARSDGVGSPFTVRWLSVREVENPRAPARIASAVSRRICAT